MDLLKNIRRAKIRSYMRGYIHLDKNEKTEYVDCVKRKLSMTTIENKKFDSFSENSEEICLQQFLIYRLLDINFNIEVLKSIKGKSKLNLTLPHSWRLLLEIEGFKANTLNNKFNWFLFQLKWFFVGILTGINQIIKSFNKNLINSDCVYFYDLSPKNFPNSENDSESISIISWFIGSFFSKGVKAIAHTADFNLRHFSGTEILKTKGPFPSLDGTKRLIFIFWFLKKIFRSLVNFNERILLRERIFLKIISLASKESLPSSYYFHNNWTIFKPLWTYEAEKKGIDVILYFYSTNIFSLIEKGKNENLFFNPWLFSRWKKILVWNKSQEAYIKKKSSIKSIFYRVGPIPFYSSSIKLNLQRRINKPKILVFDVQPLKTSFFYSLAPYSNYYTYKNSKQFLNDINLLATKIGASVYIKRKRDANIISKSYLKLLSRFVKKDHWIEIDANFDAFRLTEILKPDISINRPFTSTAYVTNFYNIPSIYYDPSKKLDKTKYSFVEIKLINEYKKLNDWAFKSIKI